MKIKIQNAWNKNTNSFDRDKYNLKVFDKLLAGSFQMSKKDKETDKWINSAAMNLLIEKLYGICEHFGLKDYELTSYEIQGMMEYYNKKEV